MKISRKINESPNEKICLSWWFSWIRLFIMAIMKNFVFIIWNKTIRYSRMLHWQKGVNHDVRRGGKRKSICCFGPLHFVQRMSSWLLNSDPYSCIALIRNDNGFKWLSQAFACFYTNCSDKGIASQWESLSKSGGSTGPETWMTLVHIPI